MKINLILVGCYFLQIYLYCKHMQQPGQKQRVLDHCLCGDPLCPNYQGLKEPAPAVRKGRGVCHQARAGVSHNLRQTQLCVSGPGTGREPSTSQSHSSLN